MKISRVAPPPREKEIHMVFPISEGWAIVAALKDYVRQHTQAVERDLWNEWANNLDNELRR